MKIARSLGTVHTIYFIKPKKLLTVQIKLTSLSRAIKIKRSISAFLFSNLKGGQKFNKKVAII